MKTYIIIAYDGTEVIDGTPEAEIRIAAMDELEEKAKRELKRNRQIIHRLVKNPLWRLACACGIV